VSEEILSFRAVDGEFLGYGCDEFGTCLHDTREEAEQHRREKDAIETI